MYLGPDCVIGASIALIQQVYDVTYFAQQHPGGRVIYTYAGKDATDVFAGFHSPASWALLKPLYVGELDEVAGSRPKA